jgi:hypothetical protein
MPTATQYSDVLPGEQVLPAASQAAYSDVEPGEQVLGPAAPPIQPPSTMAAVPGAVPGTPPPTQAVPRPSSALPPPVPGPSDYVAAPNQQTPEERIGELIPQSAVPALAATEKALTYLPSKGAEAGRALGRATLGVGSEKDVAELPGGQTALGIAGGVGSVAGSTLADPLNWPFLESGGARPLLQRVISLGFTGMLTKNGLDAATNLHDNWDKMTPEQRAELASKAGISTLLAGAGMHHAINPKLAIASSPAETRVGVAVDPLGTGPMGVEARFPKGGYERPAQAEIEAPTIEGQGKYSDVAPGEVVLPPEPKPVIHATNDVEQLRASAEKQAPKIGDAVSSAVEKVPGAKLEAVRDAKDSDRIEDKAERQGVQPSQIGDIAAAKVTVPDQKAADQVLANLDKTLPVEKVEGSVTGEPGKNAVRQVQAIVDTQQPGEPVRKAEILLQTPEMHAATEETHEDYRKAQELRAAGKNDEAQKIEDRIAQVHEEAARGIQIGSTATLHGGPQEAVGKKGSGHERVGEQDQLQQPPSESTEAAPEKEAGTYFGPQSVDSIAGTNKYPALAGKGVAVPGEPNAKAAAEKVARQPGEPPVPPQKKVIGVDFDGTLFKENPDGSIGAPIPERIASLKQDLAAGKKIEIESKRAGHPGGTEEIHAALESVGLPRLPVTAKKTAASTLIDNEAPKEPGVVTEKVATDANTPLPGAVPERLDISPEKQSRHEGALVQAKAELPKGTLSEQLRRADEIERGNRKPGEAPKPNPQGGLFASESGSFEPAKLSEAAEGVAKYLAEAKKATDIARNLQRDLATLSTAKEADILRGVQTMKVMKTAGLTTADDANIYHHLEDPTVELKGDQEKWLDDIILPIQKQNTEFYKELTDGGVPIEDYVHRVVKGKAGMLDRIAQGVQAVGKKGTLSKAAPQTKARTYMVIENADGQRQVVSVKGGQVTAWKDGEPENLGGVSTTDEGQKFVDKDGAEWKLKQATTKEIEAQAGTEYYHSALASTIASNIQLGSAVRAMNFLESYKASPEFKETAWHGTGAPPKGWQPTKLPQFPGYYFEPRTAEVLDDYYDRMRNGQFGVLNSIQKFLRAAYLINPIVHPMNVAASWSMEKGLTGFAPWNWHTIYKTGTKAVKAVLSQNQDFLDALDAGGALQSHREELQDIHKLFFERLAEGLDKKEPRIVKIAHALGIEHGNLLNLLHKPSSIAAWNSSDILYLQAAYQYQAEHSGASLKDALKEVGRIIPEYRLPSRIADSRVLSKAMGNPLISWFGAYHYGILKSFGEAAKSALGAQEPTEGRTKAEEVGKGWDRLALMGLITFLLYPYIFDKGAKLLTGDEHARVRRPGPMGYLDAAAQVAERKQSASSAIQKVVTPSPLTKGAAELAFNKDFFTGHDLYDPHADWRTQTQEIGRYLLGDFGMYGQYNRAATSEQKNRFWWQQAQVQFGKTRAEKVAGDIAAAKVGTEAESPEDQKNRVQRREILDQLRKGNHEPFEKARAAHELTHRQVLDLQRRAKLTPLEDTVHNFTIPETQKVLDAARADRDQKEIDTLSRILRQKRARARAYYEGRQEEVVQ